MLQDASFHSLVPVILLPAHGWVIISINVLKFCQAKICIKLLANRFLKRVLYLFYFSLFFLLLFFFFTYPFIHFFRAEVDSDPATDKDEIMFCCGQLIAHGLGEHILCDGKEDKLASDMLLLELEKCPHSGCGARFGMAPLRNLEHQDTIHHCILSFI